MFIEAKKDELGKLLEIARIQSTKSSNRIEGIFTTDKRLEELIKKLIQNTTGKINKKEILAQCPDISTKTVERALADLVKKGLIEKVGASSATAYVWIQDNK